MRAAPFDFFLTSSFAFYLFTFALLLPSPLGERAARAAAPVRDDFGEDGEGDLFGRDRADVEADGRAHPVQRLLVEARLAQAGEHDVGAAAAADHADVVGAGGEHGPHALLVLVVPARDDRDVDAAPVADYLFERVSPVRRGDQLDPGFGEAPARDEVRAVVYECDAVAGRARETRQRRADVPRAADDDARLRLDALEHDARLAPVGERRRELRDAQRLRLGARGEERARLMAERLVERRVAGRPRPRARLFEQDFRADAPRGLDDRGEHGRRPLLEDARDRVRELCGSVLAG